MTPDDLRQDADRREALARKATPGPWNDAYSRCTAVRAGESSPLALVYGVENAAYIAANDPPAALAQCERDRLLSDAIALLGEAYFHPDSAGPDLRQKVLARFAALEVTGE